MSVEIATLGIDVDTSNIRRGRDELSKLGDEAERAADSLDDAGKRGSSGIDSIASSIRAVQAAFAAVGVSQAIKAVIAINDEYAQVEGRLKLVTSSAEELAAVQDKLFAVAQKTGVAYAETANLYAKVAKNADALGLSQQQLLDFTEVTNQAIQVSGASASEAAGGVRQLGQALASGALRGDEFNSLAENMPRLRDAIADGLGMSIGKLREFAAEGKLTAEVVTQALLSQKSVIESEFEQLPITVGRAMMEMENEVKRAVAGADTTPLTDAIRELTKTLSDPAVITGIAGIAGALVKLAKAAAEAAGAFADLGTWIGETAARAAGFSVPEDQLRRLREMRDIATGAGNTGLVGELNKQIIDLKQQFTYLREADIPAVGAAVADFYGTLSAATGGVVGLGQATAGVLAPLADVEIKTKAAAAATIEKAESDKSAADAAKKHADAIGKFRETVEKQNKELEAQIKLIRAGMEAEEAATRVKLKMGGALDGQIDKQIELNKALKEAKELQEFSASFSRVTGEQVADILGPMVDSVSREAAESARQTLEDAIDDTLGGEKAKQAADDFADNLARQSEQEMSRAITDALFRGFESGKGFAENFADVLGNAIKTSLAKNLEGILSDTFGDDLRKLKGSTIGASTLGGVLSAGGIAGLAGQTAGGLFENSSRFDGATSSRVGAGAAIGAGVGATFGTVALPVIGTVAGSIVGGIVGGLGGAVVSALGGGEWKIKRQEIGLSITDAIADATVTTVKRKKSIFGSKTKTGTNDVEELDAIVSDAFGDIYDVVIDNAATLGFAATSFKATLEASIKGLKPEEVQARLNELLTQASDQLINQTVPGIDAFQQSNEQLIDTLLRVAQQTQAVTQVVGYMGGSMDALVASMGTLDPLAAAGIADSIAQLSGGIGAFSSNFQTYINGFYSAAERTAVQTAQINDYLAPLGIALPETAAGFRLLVDSLLDVNSGLNITSEEGQKAYAALLQVAGGATAVYEAQKQAAAASAQQAQQQLSQAQQAVAQSQQNLIGAYTAAISAASAQVDKWRELERTMRGFADSLLDRLIPATAAATAQFRREYDALATQARAGSASAMNQLPSAGNAYLDQLRNTAGTALEYQLGVASVRSDALLSADAAGGKADSAQRSLAALQGSLDELIKQSEIQLSEVQATLSVSAAIADLATAEAAYAAAQQAVSAQLAAQTALLGGQVAGLQTQINALQSPTVAPAAPTTYAGPIVSAPAPAPASSSASNAAILNKLDTLNAGIQSVAVNTSSFSKVIKRVSEDGYSLNVRTVT